MIHGRPGLDVSSLVRGVLDEAGPRASRLTQRLTGMVGSTVRGFAVPPAASVYARLFGTTTGVQAINAIGNEAATLDALSSLAIEVVLEYLDDKWGLKSGSLGMGRRYLAVGGAPQDPPALLVLDPAITDVSQSRRLTDELDLDPHGLVAAFERLRPFIAEGADPKLTAMLSGTDAEAALHLLWIAQPEIVLSRRPRMVPLCVPSPYVTIVCSAEISTAGVFCRDTDSDLGITACYHGTGPVGTLVRVGETSSVVKRADAVQDIVFISLGTSHQMPPLCGRGGVRTSRAPSEAEPVSFEGAGSGRKVTTYIKSHDAGILRSRRSIQLKVQTPADTNTGDSGSALIDSDEKVVAFAFERTGFGEFPELTDWIWAANALSALGLTTF